VKLDRMWMVEEARGRGPSSAMDCLATLLDAELKTRVMTESFTGFNRCYSYMVSDKCPIIGE